MSKLPVARIKGSGWYRFSPIFGPIAMAVAIGLSCACVQRCETVKTMTIGEAEARSSVIIHAPINGCWGDSAGWQCATEDRKTWTACYDGECRISVVVK